MFNEALQLASGRTSSRRGKDGTSQFKALPGTETALLVHHQLIIGHGIESTLKDKDPFGVMETDTKGTRKP